MDRFAPPSRREYLKRQKEERHRHLLGVFPAQYPREILRAMDVLPVEIWDPPLEVTHANAHLQPSICSVVRLGLELILQGRCEILDGFLFPHTCDSIQNLASLIPDYLGTQKPCHFFYHPKGPYRPSMRIYYREHLQRFVTRLERHIGPLDPLRLIEEIEKGRRISALLKELYDLRAKGELRCSGGEFYQVIRQGEFLHPDDYIPLLEAFLAASRGAAERGPAVVLSGVLPNPREILPLLDQLGVRVGEDDLLSCGRRLLVPLSQAQDPLDALTEAYFSMPACSTRACSIEDRLRELLVKVERSGARGVIFLIVKYCEPELFYLPALMDGLKKKGLATLVIDTDLNQGLTGQITTRVEAFAEMLT